MRKHILNYVVSELFSYVWPLISRLVSVIIAMGDLWVQLEILRETRENFHTFHPSKQVYGADALDGT